MEGTRPQDLKVLVVEDYEDSRLAMRLGLEDRGYRVLEAADGEEAVRVASAERPDVILMDLGLPGLDGLGATRRIRQAPGAAAAIVVAVTAHQEADYRSKALAAGCNAYVTKPIDFDWLDDLISSLLP